MFNQLPVVGTQPLSSTSLLWTNMESNKVMCPTFSVMLVRTIKALCEINIRFDHKLEISGSLHVRSDGDKVMTCLIDEESIKGAQDLSILDAVRFTMPYAAAALAPMAIPGGFGQQSAQLTEALMSPMGQAIQPTSLPSVNEKDSKHLTSNGAAAQNTSREQPQIVNIVPTDPQTSGHPMDMANLNVLNNKTPEMQQLTENDTGMLMQHRLSGDGTPRPGQDMTTTSSTGHKMDTSKSSGHGSKLGAKTKTSHSSSVQTASVTNTTGQTLSVPSGQQASQSSAQSQNQSLPAGQQNHVKLPNIQTFAGMLPRLPQIKTESKEAASPLPRTSEPPSFPSPPQNLASSPMSTGYGVDPLVGVKVEVQSQVDAEGNVIQKKKYQCMFCGIFLSTKCYLKNHINAMHTKARVYPCEVCEKYFYSAGALRIHKLRNHWQGSKKHKCEHCGETFLLPIELRKHLMKKHSELEDFEGGGSSSGHMGNLTRGATDPGTGPSSGGSSPRTYADKAMFPLAQTMQSIGQAAMVHGSPVFPAPILHTTESIHKDVVDGSTTTDAIGLETDNNRVTQGAPVFPSPIVQAINHPGGTSKSAINASVTETSTE